MTKPTIIDTTTPEALMRTFTACVASADLDALVDLYEPDAVFEPEPGVVVSGHADIRAALEQLLALEPEMEASPAFRTWVRRIAVNHLLDRKRSAVERHELTFDLFAADLRVGLEPAAASMPNDEILAREVKHGCTLALLTCLDRELRVRPGQGVRRLLDRRCLDLRHDRSGVPQAPLTCPRRDPALRRPPLRARRRAHDALSLPQAGEGCRAARPRGPPSSSGGDARRSCRG